MCVFACLSVCVCVRLKSLSSQNRTDNEKGQKENFFQMLISFFIQSEVHKTPSCCSVFFEICTIWLQFQVFNNVFQIIFDLF